MRTEKDIAAALRALKDADSGVEGSAELEARVLGEYRRRAKRRGWIRPMIALAAAAAIVVAMVALRHPRAAEVAHLPKEAPRVVVPVASAPGRVEGPVKVRTVQRRPREIVTEFFPLMEAPPPVDHGELLRVMVPAATMRTVGLPVADDRLTDRVQADVLVSEEGIATAIRFVKYQ